jgi:hypothetical protein
MPTKLHPIDFLVLSVSKIKEFKLHAKLIMHLKEILNCPLRTEADSSGRINLIRKARGSQLD